VKFNADSINTHRKEQQVSLAVFLPSNGDHSLFVRTKPPTSNPCESHSVRKNSYVHKVQRTFKMGIQVLSDILESCNVRWKTNKTHSTLLELWFQRIWNYFIFI